MAVKIQKTFLTRRKLVVVPINCPISDNFDKAILIFYISTNKKINDNFFCYITKKKTFMLCCVTFYVM